MAYKRKRILEASPEASSIKNGNANAKNTALSTTDKSAESQQQSMPAPRRVPRKKYPKKSIETYHPVESGSSDKEEREDKMSKPERELQEWEREINEEEVEWIVNAEAMGYDFTRDKEFEVNPDAQVGRTLYEHRHVNLTTAFSSLTTEAKSSISQSDKTSPPPSTATSKSASSKSSNHARSPAS
jgi:hypothetical protein